jgi:hypothetical protein
VFSTEDLEKAKELITQLNRMNLNQANSASTEKDSPKNKGAKNNRDQRRNKEPENQSNGGNQTSCLNLLPSELLVIAGIICDVLQVNSVLVDRNQGVEILLTGSLKRSTQLDKIMHQIGKMPFDQVVKSIMENSSPGN